ncbi:hypothetical protein [Lysinibacillus sp. OF-1]|uniref:hypothetical protein n=1 Tax=Lysinibacillus sp. OF-1 TaxID=2972483 RepID=UPI00232EEED9|nr:hypothetical protein [Lysinibacillus sp. OF-1]WCH48138.1 hypothetical protein NV349_01770 [Lysinibacillus sp. OF-1]
MNWVEEAKKIRKQYDDAKDIYNESMLKIKRKEYQKKAKSLLDQYNNKANQRKAEVQARLKELDELISAAKPLPIFNFEHYFKNEDIKSEYGTKLGTKKVIDVEYITGIKYLSEYVENTLSRLNNYDDYLRAITEITESDNKQAIEVLYSITANGFKPSFIKAEAWDKGQISLGAHISEGRKSTDYTVQNVRALHDVIHERYKDVTYPEGLRDLEKEQKALINENLMLVGSTPDVDRAFLYETVTYIDGSQLFNGSSPKW